MPRAVRRAACGDPRCFVPRASLRFPCARSGASSLLFRSRERVETGAVSYDPDVRSPLQPASLVHAFRSAA